MTEEEKKEADITDCLQLRRQLNSSYNFMVVVLLIGVVLGCTLSASILTVMSTPEKVKYKKGDRVVVTSGFYAGRTGKLANRIEYSYGVVVYGVTWDDPENSGNSGIFSEKDFVPVTDWVESKPEAANAD